MTFELLRDEDSLKLTPVFSVRDIIPLSLCIVGVVISLVVAGVSFFGVFYSIIHNELVAAVVSLLFSVVAIWITRALAFVSLQTGPRHVIYSATHRHFELVLWGWKHVLLVSHIDRISARLEVTRGGFRTAQGVWFYLIFRIENDRVKKFLVARLPSLTASERSTIRDVLERFSQVSGVNASGIEIQES